ncbi:MAG TPA: kynureninase [Caulobacteraceae bacterium]|nr:kynureninase [Caulobacteraceae bacterium]
MTLEVARDLDRTDPLAGFRDRFVLPEGVIYLDGNSLGPLAKPARARIADVVEREWGQSLIRSWNDAHWIEAPQRVGDKIAHLIGARPGEVVVADSTSVNLHKLLVAALRAQTGRATILTETGNFPTDLYVAHGAAAAVTGARVKAVDPAALETAIDGDTAVVLATHVHYKSADRRDMAGLTAAAHRAGALILWDLSHSAGAVPLDLAGSEADLAVGCGYKFLNGGPGAPAFLYVAERHQAVLTPTLTGWMGHAAPFDFSDDWRPAEGISRFLTGTPPILGLAGLEAGVDLALEVDETALSRKAEDLWNLFAQLMESRLAGHGFSLLTSRDPARRGSHIAYAHPEGFRIVQALMARSVIGDFREPDVVRFGLTPLYLSFEDIWRAVEVLAGIMAGGAWRQAQARIPGQVT